MVFSLINGFRLTPNLDSVEYKGGACLSNNMGMLGSYDCGQTDKTAICQMEPNGNISSYLEPYFVIYLLPNQRA
jgi:hypothetical protein